MNRTALVIALLASATARAAVPKVLSFTGTLADAAGVPVPDGSQDVTFRFFRSVSGGTAFWQNTYALQTVSGVFTALLGTNSAVLEPSFFATDQVWLEIEVAGDVLGPRMRVVSVPYALAAATLDCVGCVDGVQTNAAEIQARVTGTCSGGQAVGAVNQDGTGVCVSAGGTLVPGPGIEISTGIVSTSFAGSSCTPPDKVSGFDAAGDPICSPDLSGSATLNFDCPGTDKVHGWDAAGIPLCETDSGGMGGGVTQVNTGAGLTGGPITTTGTVSIAPGGVLTSMIAPSAVSQTVGTADLFAECADPMMSDACTIGSAWTVLFTRDVVDAGLYMFIVHLNVVSHLTVGGAFGLQLNNATANTPIDPDDLFDTWDYTFPTGAPSLSITRTFIYEKFAAGLETIEVRGIANVAGTVIIEPYSSLGGHNAGMHVVHLKR
jgi:hypothetical protein